MMVFSFKKSLGSWGGWVGHSETQGREIASGTITLAQGDLVARFGQWTEGRKKCSGGDMGKMS